MDYSNNTILNHYVKGDSFEDIAKASGVEISVVREYLSRMTTLDLAKQKVELTPISQSLYYKCRHNRVERGLIDEPF